MDAVSSSSGSDFMPSFPAATFTVPPLMMSSPSEARPLFAALTFTVLDSIVMVASEAPLMPFLQAEPSAVRTPLPVIVRDAPDLTFIAAPSKSSFVSSVEASSRSVRVTEPEI